ncbi:hypothetical protein [Hymenobacter antarcticus]|uniref:WYL domain-containing protein n=1 Tax=Hymenobacter antarcticus TaxID=486270 RepID=A0ABP7PTI6_9BACT
MAQPLHAAQVAARFKPLEPEKVELLLATLATLSLVRQLPEGTYVALPIFFQLPTTEIYMPAPASRDYSQWILSGRSIPLKKGAFLLAVFEDFVADKLTVAQLHEVFRPVEELPASLGNRTVFKLSYEVTDEVRFNRQPIRTAGGQLVRVSTQWSWANFPYVLRAVHQAFGIRLQGCRLTDQMRASMRRADAAYEEVDC